jgi:Domain of unknown function (DUF1707)
VDDRRKMRASDADRQEAVERLRVALDEGRLKMNEYLERMEHAYEAVTYGDLEVLYHDLPEATSVAQRDPARSAPAPKAAAAAAPAPSGVFASLPAPLKVLWTIWLVAVSVNVVIWVLVTATTGHLIYPWPVWVAGPYGAVLLSLSAVAAQHRRRRGPAAPPLPPGNDP